MAISVKQQEYSDQARILSRLAAEVGESLFGLWFSSADCLVIHQDTVEVFAASDFELRRIQRGFGNQLRRIASDVLGRSVRVEYSVRVVEEKQTVPEQSAASAVLKSPHFSKGQLFSKAQFLSAKNLDATPTIGEQFAKSNETVSPLRPAHERSQTASRHVLKRPELREFYFGEENEFAQAAVKQLLIAPGQYSPLLLHGGSGSGKSHLLESLTIEIRRRHRVNRCVYVTAEQFTSSFLQSLRGGGLPVFRSKYRDVDVLAVDDIQFFANKRATIAEFQYTLDHLIRAGKQIMLGSDRTPLELTELGPEILNRVSCGLVCPLHFAEVASRVQIAQRMCCERNLNWSSVVLTRLAERSGKDGRRISGAINQLSAASFVKRRPVDCELVDEVMPPNANGRNRFTTLPLIEKHLCELFGISLSEIRSGSRARKVSVARMLAMWFARKYTACALSEIGQHFGGRSHSTVIAAQKRVAEMIEKQESVNLPLGCCLAADAIQTLENKLNCN